MVGMTDLQRYAITHPLARARGNWEHFRRFDPPWSKMLTVNK
jgi:hypothetical protein